MNAIEVRAELQRRLPGYDEIVLAATLIGEAATEPIDGVVAVACAIRNRVTSDLHGDGRPDWWGEGYAGVCLQSWQFSCWWETHPNTERVYEVAEAMLGERASKLVPAAKVATMRALAATIIAGGWPDITGGADHYLTTKLLNSSPPPWARGNVPALCVIGSHTFFKLEGRKDRTVRA